MKVLVLILSFPASNIASYVQYQKALKCLEDGLIMKANMNYCNPAAI
jgi:hypothetical protein